MSRYTAKRFDEASFGAAESPVSGAGSGGGGAPTTRLGPKRLLDTPSPGSLNSGNTRPSSRETEFTPMLHTVKKDTADSRSTPVFVKPIQTKTRPKSLLRYSTDQSDSMMSLNNTSSFSGLGNQNTPVPKQQHNQKQKAMVAEDPTSLPLREQARHTDLLEKENMDLKLKLQLLQKRFINISGGTTNGGTLTDITNSAELEETAQWMRKCVDLEQKYRQLQGEMADQQYDFNRKIDELQADLDAREAENTNYADRIDRYESRIEELMEQLESQSKNNQSNNDSSNDGADRSIDSDQLKDLNDRITDLEYQNRSLEEDVERLEGENAQLKDEIAELREQVDSNDSNDDSSHSHSHSRNLLQEEREKLLEEKEELLDEKKQLLEQLLAAEDDVKNGKDREAQLETLLQEAQEEARELRENLHNGSTNDKTNDSMLAKHRNLSRELDHEKDARQQLEHEVGILTSENAQMKKDLATYRQEIDSLKKEVITANSLAKRLQKEADGYKREAEYMQEQYEKAKDDLMDVTRAANESVLIKNNELEIDRLREEVDAKQETIKQLTERWDSDKKMLNDKIRSLEQTKDASERQLMMLMSRQDTLHMKSIINSEKEKSEKAKVTLSKEIEHLKKQLANVTEERDALSKKYTALNTARANESMQESQTLKDNNELRTTIEKLELEAVKHEREILKLKALVDEHKINLDTTRELRNIDVQKITDLEKELEAANTEIAAAKESYREAEAKIKLFQSKLNQADDRIVESEKTKIDLEEEAVNELDALSAKLQKAHIENNRLDSLLVDARFQADEARSEARELKRRLRLAETDLDDATRRLHGLGNSSRKFEDQQKEDRDVKADLDRSFEELEFYKNKFKRERVLVDQLRKQVVDLEKALEKQIDFARDRNNVGNSASAKDWRSRSQGSVPGVDHQEMEEKYQNLWNAYVHYVKFNKLHLKRELELKHDLEFTKDYLMAKSGKFLHSNIKTLEMFANIGLYPDYKKLSSERRTLRGVAYTVLAAVKFTSRLQEFRSYQHELNKVHKIKQLII